MNRTNCICLFCRVFKFAMIKVYLPVSVSVMGFELFDVSMVGVTL